MNKYGGIYEKLARKVDLDTEPAPGLPIVEVAGENRVLVERHRGVVKYTCNEIGIKVKYGYVNVQGCGLQLQLMTRQRLVITGQIECIKLCKGR